MHTRLSLSLVSLLALLASGLGASAAPEPEFHDPHPRVPLSAAVTWGDLVFLSGQLGIDPATGELAPGGVGPETRQALANVGRLVDRHGSSIDRVVKCTVFLVDLADYGPMNEEYRRVFSEKPPARSAMAVAGLALGARVEIECLAVRGPSGEP